MFKFKKNNQNSNDLSDPDAIEVLDVKVVVLDTPQDESLVSMEELATDISEHPSSNSQPQAHTTSQNESVVSIEELVPDISQHQSLNSQALTNQL